MKTLSLDNHVMRNPDVISTDTGGETLMMSIEKGFYYGLNSVGSRVWALLEQNLSVGEICRLVEAEYEIDIVECERAVMAFIEQLAQNDLVSIS